MSNYNLQKKEVNIDDVRKLRITQLRLLDTLDTICKKHGFHYWLDFGTLLGAVRNGKFIPWDDDIDVSMNMEDYIKFQKIAKTELPDDIFLQTPKTDPTYQQHFVKLRDNNSTFIEFHENDNMPYHQGIFIDIFPAYLYPKMPRIILKVLTRYTLRTKYAAYVRTKYRWFNIPTYHCFRFIWYLISFLPKTRYAQTPEDNGYAYSVPLEHLYPLGEIEFEGKKYPAPKNPHAHLTIIYGEDYITPPPIHNRTPHAKLILPNTPCNRSRTI